MSEWISVKISEICDVTRGASPRPIQDFMAEGGIPWVKISDATNTPSRFITKTKEFIKPEGEQHSKTVHPGDFILSNSATPGLPKFMNIRACIHDGWLLLRNFKQTDKLFLYYRLLQDRENLVSLGNGSIFTNLKTEILKDHKILLPTLEEQQAIAEVLSSLDDKIDLLHRNNKTLEQMAETLFRQWFVEDESKWGTVKDEFDVIMGQSPPGNTYNENKQGIPFYQGRTDFTFRFPERRVFCTAPTRMAKAFDTLLSVRAPVGDVNIAIEDCCIGRGLASLRHKNKNVHYSYTYLLFNYIKDSFDVHEQSGTVFGSISKDELLALKCPVLTKAELFNKEISLLEDKVTENSKQIFKLTDIKETLLPKLMNGQVRVNIN